MKRLIALCLFATLVACNAAAQSAAPTSPARAVAKTLQRPDLVLHYTDYGQGEPVLLLMGGPGISGAGLEPVARMIAKQGRAIVPDQRGSGKSMPTEATAITLA